MFCLWIGVYRKGDWLDWW